MSQNRNVANESKITDRPRDTLSFIFFAVFMIWQSLSVMVAMVIFIVAVKLLKCDRRYVLLLGLSLAISVSVLALISLGSIHLTDIIKRGFHYNQLFWIHLIRQDLLFWSFFRADIYYFAIGVSLLLAILTAVDFIPNTAHESALRSIQGGRERQDLALSKEALEKKLSKLTESDTGTVLGVSMKTGETVEVTDKAANQSVLFFGTAGGGKSISIRRFFQSATRAGHPLIIVDGKPEANQINAAREYAEKHNRPFYGFNCGQFNGFDVLSEGNATELKDKMICLKDEWSSDHYRSIAENYLQAVFSILISRGQPFNLLDVVELLDHNNLCNLVRNHQLPKSAQETVTRLKAYEGDDLKGLQAHFEQLIYSEMGAYLIQRDNSFSLRDVVNQNGVVYFALPALQYPSFTQMMGKLVINDIKTLIQRGVDGKRLYLIFDEFSVFAGEQALNLVNMGRGMGVHAIFGTQGYADLQRVDLLFADQFLNCINTVIAHRVNDQKTAEALANWSGTVDRYDVTAQVTVDRNMGVGSVKKIKVFEVHPDTFKKQLGVGEAIYMTKIGGFAWDKIKVKMG